jgi:hypothetical protein
MNIIKEFVDGLYALMFIAFIGIIAILAWVVYGIYLLVGAII